MKRHIPIYLAAWGFVAPALSAIAVFFVLPVVAALALSVTDFDLYALADLRNLRFVALDNYLALLQKPLFWQALGNTAYFVLVACHFRLPRHWPARCYCTPD